MKYDFFRLKSVKITAKYNCFKGKGSGYNIITALPSSRSSHKLLYTCLLYRYYNKINLIIKKFAIHKYLRDSTHKIKIFKTDNNIN